MDSWLKNKALANQVSGASRTFVVAEATLVVRGYYALASGAIDRTIANTKVRRNMPNPIPVFVLGRLAIDEKYQGRGLGSDLLRDSILRTSRLAHEVGIRALVVHALNEKARNFYLAHGFSESPLDPLILMLKVSEIFAQEQN